MTLRPKSLNDSAAELELECDKVPSAESSDPTFAQNKLTLYASILYVPHKSKAATQPQTIKEDPKVKKAVQTNQLSECIF